MQTWVFSPNKRTNALKKKKTASLPQTIFKNFSARTGYPVTTTTTTTRTMQMKKKKSHQPPQYKSKKKNVGSLKASIQKIRTASVQSAPSFAFHFCHPLPSLTEEATGGRLRKKQMWQGQSLLHSKCHGASSTKVFLCVCVCVNICADFRRAHL